jgi:predicted phage terminase large subunit-like protein
MADGRAGVTQRAAALELLRRQRARASLVEYARSVNIPGAPAVADPETEHFKSVETSLALHHRIILEHIEKTVFTPFGRLLMFAPPGSAKSSYTSVVSPAHLLSRLDGYRIILGSYAQEIANKQSRKARALCRSKEHLSIWSHKDPPPVLATDQRAVHQWGLANGSEFMAAGLLSGITGNRANGLLIDDPIKGREEADSETIRNKVYDEFMDSATTRLLPGGWIIVIQTRWHEDDLAGRILPEDYDGSSGRILCRDGQWWTVLNLRAKVEDDAQAATDPLGRKAGEYLWPEWFPREHWAQWEHNPRAVRTWNALFQQRPSALEGIEFKREWFKWYDPDVPPGTPGGRPTNITVYGASDYATKEDKGDFTEHGVVGVAPANIEVIRDGKKTFVSPMYFLDWWSGQKTTDVSIDAFTSLVHRWAPRKWWNEGGPIDNALSPSIKKAMSEHDPRVFVSIDPLTSIKNKAIKLGAFQWYAAQGLVHLPLRRPWANRLVDQLCAFPTGRYDDAADVCGLLGRGLDVMMSPHVPSEETRPQLKPFTAAWLETVEDHRPMTPRYS